MKFIKVLDPEPTAKVKRKHTLVGYNLMGLFESEEGVQTKRVLTFQPTRQMFKQTSKYVPHQGEQEKKRRVDRGW